MDTSSKITTSTRITKTMLPGSFDATNHYYTKVLNATIHPVVSYFFRFDRERLIKRFCHLNPAVDNETLRCALSYKPKYLRWAGADLFPVTTEAGVRRMALIEVNSSPSGQKSMPLLDEHDEQGGYRRLVEYCFKPLVHQKRLPEGDLAVVYDKNLMEASGYAAAIADCFNEPVHLVPFFQSEPDPPVRFENGIMHIQLESGEWRPIKAALRYVTQQPWKRIPMHLKTKLLNPPLACLAGGRNKMVADQAYAIYNAELEGSGLRIRTPETIRDARKEEVPLLVKQFGGHAVVKVPYTNAGQGVYTITNEHELDKFLEAEHPYNEFIVQSLIGNYEWSSSSKQGKFYHVGTVPNRNGEIFVADVRLMIAAGEHGYQPMAVYARRAEKPLSDTLNSTMDSWEMLGTNLSIKKGDDSWDSDSKRLRLMDRKDFNLLGLGLDSLIEGYIQTVLAATAIDKMACTLVNQKKRFRMKLFRSINPDKPLLEEILLG